MYTENADVIVGRWKDGRIGSVRAIRPYGPYGAVAPQPRLRKRVRQQRHGAGLALGVTHEQVDQTLLDAQPRLLGRPLDGRAQSITGERADEVQALLDEPPEGLVRAEADQVVGSDRDDHGPDVASVRHQLAAGGPDRLRRVSDREQLFELVDDEHGRTAAVRSL